MPLNSGISNDKNFGKFTSMIERKSKLSSRSSGKSALFFPHATRTVFTALIPRIRFEFLFFELEEYQNHSWDDHTIVVVVLCG